MGEGNLMPWYMEYLAPIVPAYNLDRELVEAFILQESSGHADAFRYEHDFYMKYIMHNPRYAGQDSRRVSSSYGLMQVMYTTAVEHGFAGEPEELFLPRVNLEMGCEILSRLFDWTGLDRTQRGTMRQVAAAYNGGKGNWHGDDPQRYAGQVLNRYATLRGEKIA